MESMIYLAYFAALIVLAVVLKRLFARSGAKPADGTDAAVKACATCSEAGGKCLQDCVIENAARDIEYFDDEELDRFKRRPSDKYDDDEAAEFAEVMYTMKPEEVKDWLVSLQRRDVNLPDQLKDEAIMLAGG